LIRAAIDSITLLSHSPIDLYLRSVLHPAPRQAQASHCISATSRGRDESETFPSGAGDVHDSGASQKGTLIRHSGGRRRLSHHQSPTGRLRLADGVAANASHIPSANASPQGYDRRCRSSIQAAVGSSECVAGSYWVHL
jgi:hypothetical protein